ncbi:hypothetical protein [[Clostridium] colinum]|uniref:hypothetical protein n=1 Tax=[Clostridium] colinum TaxID=36835 RepID=UPI002024A7A7|nr:hypothetical protein [[Clostridium] colinum]
MTKKYILKIALIYTGTILGAGFATGKELVNFFAIFNKIGIVGFFIACLLLSICSIAILQAIYNTKAKTYDMFLYDIFGKLGKYIQYFNTVLLFVLFSAMLAGGGATISNILSINEPISLAIFCIITFFALIFGKKAIININTVLCPILILGGVLIGIYLQFFSSVNVFSNNTKAIISPFIYTSYNAITTISVLFAVKNIVINRKVVVFGGLLGGIFIFFIGISMLLPLIENITYIKDAQLPILSLIENKGIIKNLYSFTVLAAIFTTAVSNGVALEDSFKNLFKIKGIYIKIGIIALGVIFSTMGFSDIVATVYPIFGYLGLFEILVIVIMFLFNCIDK